MEYVFKHYTKVYDDENVWDAAIRRFKFIFTEFGDNVYLSFSGGKDSSTMCQIANKVATEMGRKFDVLYIDLEGNYKATRKHVVEISKLPAINNFYWCCLPLKLRNGVSQLQTHWVCWDKNFKKKGGKWIRPRPKDSVNEDNYLDYGWDWFEPGEQFETFIVKFAKWYRDTRGSKVATCVGIRCDESLKRFHTIVAEGKPCYKNQTWTTLIAPDIYNCYPMYDWRTEDVYGAMARPDFCYNHFYEAMFTAGRKISQVRLCQPYGDDQRQGLDQFKFFEPETWGKVLVRVNGVNFGNIYARTMAIGDHKLQKPDDMTWEEYAVFLLETIGIDNIDLMRHYMIKIKAWLKYWDEHGTPVIPDAQKDIRLETKHIAPSWRRVCKMLMKNDFYGHTLSYSQTKADDERINFILKKYGEQL